MSRGMLFSFRGFATRKKSEITMEVGGWVGPGLTRNFFLVENCPNKIAFKPVLIFWSSIPCVYIAKSCWLL